MGGLWRPGQAFSAHPHFDPTTGAPRASLYEHVCVCVCVGCLLCCQCMRGKGAKTDMLFAVPPCLCRKHGVLGHELDAGQALDRRGGRARAGKYGEVYCLRLLAARDTCTLKRTDTEAHWHCTCGRSTLEACVLPVTQPVFNVEYALSPLDSLGSYPYCHDCIITDQWCAVLPCCRVAC